MTEVPAGMVLVVTASEDPTADAVTAELARHSLPVVRFDVGDFPVEVRLAVRNDAARWRGELRAGSDVVDIDTVRSVYYRRPGWFRLPPGLSAADAAFAMTEARLGFGGALSSLPSLWVNHPARVAMAEYKPTQLTAAARAGFATPRTMITNDVAALRSFAADVDGPVVLKTFSSLVLDDGDVPHTVFTTVLDPRTVDAEQLAVTAHLVQEWVPKEFEVRVTMVGADPFAVAIHAGSEEGRIDWRADYHSLRYEPITPPPDVVDSMRHYLSDFDLSYGAFDFVVTPSEGWVFLECNPNGQWLWLEHETGLPIAAALADHLADGIRQC